MALEKVQVAALAERLDDLLDELEKRGIEGAEDDDGVTALLGDGAPLDEPINEAFRAATLSLGWDGSKGRVLVEARAPSEDEDEEVLDDDDDSSPDGPDVLPRSAAADGGPLVRRARRSGPGLGPAAVPAVRPAARSAGHLCRGQRTSPELSRGPTGIRRRDR